MFPSHELQIIAINKIDFLTCTISSEILFQIIIKLQTMFQ